MKCNYTAINPLTRHPLLYCKAYLCQIASEESKMLDQRTFIKQRRETNSLISQWCAGSVKTETSDCGISKVLSTHMYSQKNLRH